MKKSIIRSFFVAAIATVALSSCTTMNHSMREPNSRVEFTKNDFTLSDQVSGEAKTTKIIGIDWKRLFKKNMGTVEGGGIAISVASIPVIGNFLSDKTASYALHELMDKNKGYDVVFYPQYETIVSKPILGIGFFSTVTTVKVTARLAKLK